MYYISNITDDWRQRGRTQSTCMLSTQSTLKRQRRQHHNVLSSLYRLTVALVSAQNKLRSRKYMSPKRCPFRCGSEWHLIHGSLVHRESAPKQHLDRLSRFCSALGCAQNKPRSAWTFSAWLSEAAACFYMSEKSEKKRGKSERKGDERKRRRTTVV